MTGTHPIVIGRKVSETLGMAHNVVPSDGAVARVETLLGQERRDNLRLRVAVQPGGRSGLVYRLYFNECGPEGDAIRDPGGVEVTVDKASKPYLGGAIIGSADSIDRRGFAIDNPNAVGSCACGDSFH